MYSKEFMKFLFAYQKEECTPQKPKSYEIHFKNGNNGKPAEVYIHVQK